jgi:hypothetical protein
MHRRALLYISLGLNAALAAVCFFLTGPRQVAQRRPFTATPAAATVTNIVNRTNVVVRRQYFTWSEVESDDYPTFIANLRDIGCPDSTIRDIIIADVNQLYAQKRATEVLTPDQQWWRSEPDPAVAQAAAAKLQALETERRQLLTRLLGQGWETAAAPWSYESGVVALTGPILGKLSPEQKEAVHQIATRADQKQRAYLNAEEKAGRSPDPTELARMRLSTRDELAKILSPEQLQEFLLRYSLSAKQIRNELSGFEISPDEFKALFRLRAPLDHEIDLRYSTNDPDSVRRRQELEQQRSDAYVQALGLEKIQTLLLQKDPAFRQTQLYLEQIGAPAQTVLSVYQVNRIGDLEIQRISEDDTLTTEQQEAALRTVRETQLQSLQRILGPEAYRRYQAGQ